MKITNSEYDIIIGALETASEEYLTQRTQIKNLLKKLKDEYRRLAIKNTEEGMTAAEEEIYPSRLDTNYGESPSGRS